MEKEQKPAILTGKEGEEFDLALSTGWTKNYRDKHPGEPISHFFGKEILQKILNQEGCVGIRIYHAHSKPLNRFHRSVIATSKFLQNVVANIQGDKHLIIVGATADGNDMLNTKPAGQLLSKTEMLAAAPAAVAYDVVGQQSAPCPGSPGCPKNNLTS